MSLKLDAQASFRRVLLTKHGIPSRIYICIQSAEAAVWTNKVSSGGKNYDFLFDFLELDIILPGYR